MTVVNPPLSPPLLTRRGKELLSFLTLNLVIALGAYVTLGDIRVSQVPLPYADNPTPLGYFRSLSLFVLPCLVFGVWMARYFEDRPKRRAFLITILLLFPLGVVLDLLLGFHFFKFPNTEAVLGSRYPFLRWPAYDWSHGAGGIVGPGWVAGYIPIEEILFYGLGFTAILLTYVWCDAVLFPGQNSDRRQPVPRVFLRWWSAAGLWIVIGAGLFLAAWLISQNRRAAGQEAFPGYFLFLLVSAFLPSMVCFRVAFHFVNWRALTIAWLFVFSISQFWEASLGLPYQWWDYKHPAMMGLFIRPHCDLPIEAVLVWTLASWTAAIVYETILAALRLKARLGKSLFAILRGEPEDLEELKNLEISSPGIPPDSAGPSSR